MVTDTNTNQFKRCMETHTVYLDMFNMCSINYSPNVILPVNATTMTHQDWSLAMKFTLMPLGGSMASEVCLSDVSHIPISRSDMGYCLYIRDAKPLSLETPFSIDSDQRAYQ
jgi:hypothetical protein